MQKELALVWLFVRAIFSDWIGWMSGGVGLTLTIGAHFMSEIASPIWFWAVGAIVFLFACYRAWKREFGWAVTEDQRLWLVRVMQDGESRLAAFEEKSSDTALVLSRTADLLAWHRETLVAIQREFPKQWNHFSEIGALDSKGIDKMEWQARLLLSRLRDLK